MSKIKISENFFSTQGEGKHTGAPSVFLRVFGCNFKCKNFGRYEEHVLGESVKTNPEVQTVIQNLTQYKTYNDLPLVSTGCDSYASVYPEFKNLSPMMTIDQIVADMLALLPQKAWKRNHLVITGGEPLLGWQRAYPDLLSHPDMSDLKYLTFETNGTQAIDAKFGEFLKQWVAAMPGREITFSVSAKLSCSGEKREDAIKPTVVCSYEQFGPTYLKLVVAREPDVKEALDVIDIYQSAGFTGDVYLMPVGGTSDVYTLNNVRVADLALQNGLKYSARLHVDLYGNGWGK